MIVELMILNRLGSWKVSIRPLFLAKRSEPRFLLDLFRRSLTDSRSLISCVIVVDKEISEAKLSMNARARIVAESYLSTVSFLHFVTIIRRTDQLIRFRRSTVRMR